MMLLNPHQLGAVVHRAWPRMSDAADVIILEGMGKATATAEADAKRLELALALVRAEAPVPPLPSSLAWTTRGHSWARAAGARTLCLLLLFDIGSGVEALERARGRRACAAALG